jgi:type I restriction enzyme, S subunit
MSTIWPTVKFGEFLRPSSRPHTLGQNEDANLVGMRLYGEGPFHRELKPAMRIAKKTHFVIRAGDVIYNKLFAWKGTFGIVPPALDGMFVSDKFPTYELDRSRVDENWLRWYFRYPPLWDQAQTMSTGSAALSKLTLNPPKFLLLTMPLPSLAEQRRVVTRIEELSTQIHDARALRDTARGESNDLLFGGCEVALHRAQKLFPSEPLRALVDQERGISYGIVQTGSDIEGGIPTLRAGDLHWFSVNMTNIKRVSPEVASSYRRTTLRGGELLLRIRGGVGNLAVCPHQMIGGNVSREIAVIPLREDIDPRFAMYLLAAASNQARMVGHVKGTSYVGINLKDVRTLPLPIPPLPEQRRIVADLDALQVQTDTLKALQTEISLELKTVLPSIMDKAFRGEL